MTLIQALERHVPAARHLLSGITPTRSEEVFVWKNKNADFLCGFGVSQCLYSQARRWLDEDSSKRRLVFVEDRVSVLARLVEEDDAILLLNDLRVKLYFLETPLQIEGIAKKIAWSAVFLKMEILDLGRSPHFEAFRQIAESTHLAADLLLSDGADWGCSAIRHAKRNLTKSFRLASDLSFPGTPAIIVGAGPSLEINRHILEKFQMKALILAGGHALDRIGFAPHFAAAVDKEEPLKGMPFPKSPFCFQPRTAPQNFSLVEGEAFFVPDGHFSFLNWLAGQEGLFDSGWTVGNFLTALAVQWGCNPIVLVGMDYCYSGKKKYAQGSQAPIAGLVEAVNAMGEPVWTQRDWIMAIRWTEELARKNPDRLFLNATEGGMQCLSSIRLQDLDWKEIPVQERVDEAIRKTSLRTIPSRWAEWEQSLKRCAALCEVSLQNQEVDFEAEIVSHLLLFPLWKIWKSVFERQLDLDPHRIGLSEKMRLNEILFYQQVIQEHLDVLR